MGTGPEVEEVALSRSAGDVRQERQNLDRTPRRRLPPAALDTLYTIEVFNRTAKNRLMCVCYVCVRRKTKGWEVRRCT